jgi:hypothetical protein
MKSKPHTLGEAVGLLYLALVGLVISGISKALTAAVMTWAVVLMLRYLGVQI